MGHRDLGRAGAVALACAWIGMGSAAGAAAADDDLTQMSIEALMGMEVTSVSKREEKLSDAAAAIYVITGEDIRRAGVTSIPEALRMAPGVQVSRISDNAWAISARGFAEEFANKLLVMIDGRSVYTPLFAGVYWDVQDVMLEDVDRIEVIRGPGATLWGSNAVNGVINIITKRAEDTQGALVTAGYGNEEEGFGAVRYGYELNEDTHARVYAKYFRRDGGQRIDDTGRAHDDWDMIRGGFRLDSALSEHDDLTVQGDFYDGGSGLENVEVVSLVPPTSRMIDRTQEVQGGNLLGRWTHRFSETSETMLQVYYDRTERQDDLVDEDRDTVDVDFQHGFSLGERNRVTWGAGYRWSRDETSSSFLVGLDPEDRVHDLVSGFVQDEITAVPDRLRFIVGSKFEYNDFSGFEYQPSGRFVYTPGEQHTLWGAVSRAVRTPSRADEEIEILLEAMASSFSACLAPPPVTCPPAPPTTVPFTQAVTVNGNDDFDAEELTAFELGYRFHPAKRLSLDIATFYNRYQGLRSVEMGPITPSFAEILADPGAFLANPVIEAPLVFDNKLDGITYGAEIAASWQVTDWWRLLATWSGIQIDMDPDRDSTDLNTGDTIEGSTPTHMATLRSQMDLPGDLELDGSLFWMENLPALSVPSHLGVDVRIGWKPTDHLELSLVGRNIQESRHQEFGGTTLIRSAAKVDRSIYGKVTWTY